MYQNAFNLALESTLKPVFSTSAVTAAARDYPGNSRDLFYALIHISEHYAVLPNAYHFLKSNFQEAHQEYAAYFSAKYSPASLPALLKHSSSEHPYPLQATALNACLMQYAPIYFTEMAWLPSVTQTATSLTPLAIDLMAMYLRDLPCPIAG
jgi:hypothetical protein